LVVVDVEGIMVYVVCDDVDSLSAVWFLIVVWFLFGYD